MFNSNKRPCPYCDPIYAKHGIFSQIENFATISSIGSFDQSLAKLFPKAHGYLNKTIYYLFKILIALRVFQEQNADSNDKDLYNKSLLIIEAAKLKGLEIKTLKLFGKKSSRFFTITIGIKKIFFESFPTIDVSKSMEMEFDDKQKFKKLLKENNLPYSEGQSFTKARNGLQFAKKIGFPLVVKPTSGSLSKHTFCNLQSEKDLFQAIKNTQVLSRNYIVEKFIAGNVYRITLVNHHLVACCLREPANIVGDGLQTIRELIEAKNEHPWRGYAYEKNFTLHRIVLTDQTREFLDRQNLTIDVVPASGQKVYLHSKVILAAGADIHDRTDVIHPENKLLFQKVSKLCGALLVGLDFIGQDISLPYYEQECAILEANSMPNIDMHHFPVSGQPRDVAGRVVEHVLISRL